MYVRVQAKPPYSKEAIYYPGSKEEHVNAEDEIIQDNAACLQLHCETEEWFARNNAP